jgi:hypothetical protein
MAASGRIGVETDVNEVSLQAGESAPIQVTVTNNGYVVDAFDLSVAALDPSWYTLTPTRVSLFPHARATATLQIHPPPHAAALAGDYAFELVAVSRDDPTEIVKVPLRLWLIAAGDISLDMEPQRIVARKGTFRLMVDNESNRVRQVVLRPSDPDALLEFAFGPAEAVPLAEATAPRTRREGEQTGPLEEVAVGQDAGRIRIQSSTVEAHWTPPSAEAVQGTLDLTLPPASRVELPLTVEPKKRIWFGKEIPIRFEVAATPPGVEWEEKDVRRITGELVYRPVFAPLMVLPVALQRALAVLIPLLLLALALYLLFRPQPTAGVTANPAATQTAQALSASAAATQTAQALAAGGANSASQTQTAQALSASAAATQTAQALAAAATQTAQAAGAVRIVKFDWAATPDNQVQVTWEVTNAITVTINATPVPLVGSMPVDTSRDQSITLVATDGRNTVSQSKGVLLVQPPEIISFTADKTEVCVGCAVTLTWATTRAERVLLDGQPQAELNGSVTVRPTQTTEYLLVAESALGRVERVLAVTVNPALPTPTP